MKAISRLFTFILLIAISVCVGTSDSYAAKTTKSTIVQSDHSATLDISITADYVLYGLQPSQSHFYTDWPEKETATRLSELRFKDYRLYRKTYSRWSTVTGYLSYTLQTTSLCGTNKPCSIRKLSC
jgi:hypothetical protein